MEKSKTTRFVIVAVIDEPMKSLDFQAELKRMRKKYGLVLNTDRMTFIAVGDKK